MTFLVVAMFGTGIVLIGSSLDGTPIIETVKRILNGVPLDWTGTAPSVQTPPTAGTTGKGPITLPN